MLMYWLTWPYLNICHFVWFLHIVSKQIGSPTTLANQEIQTKIYKKAHSNARRHGLYVPSGAFWGGEDIKKMADMGSLEVSLSTNLIAFL